MTKTTMTKYEAEKLLGLKKAYVYSDVTKQYRKMVKKYHPDAGGSEDDMIKINEAKTYMDKMFAGNKNAVFNADVSDTDNVKNEQTEKADADSEPKATEDYAYDDEEYTYTYRPYVNEYENMHNKYHTYAQENAHRAVEELHKKYGYTEPVEERKYEEAWWEKAYGSAGLTEEDFKRSSMYFFVSNEDEYKKEVEGPTPVWFKIVNWFINHFPYRAVLGIFAFVYNVAYLGAGYYTTASVGVWLAIVTVGLTNLFTGWLTNPLRKAMRYAADNKLNKWKKNKGIA